MMKKKIDIAVSTDPIKDFQSILEYAKSLQDYADFIHCDVMDNKFVENKTYDFNFVKTLNAQTLIPLDVHLMTEEPFVSLENYIKSGANILTVHYEAFKDKKQLIEAFNYIKRKGCLAGLSFKPSTNHHEIKPFLFYVDIVLIMSVEPGESGQNFLNKTFDIISDISKFRQDNNLNYKIEVDGGINDKNAHVISELGADILVSGSFVYNSEDKLKAIKKLRGK